MSGEVVDVSVVVPLLNEASTVAELVTRICAVFDRRRERFELLLIDDGSHDATAARLREIEAEDPRVRVFEFTRNFGQAAALACGIFEARGRVVVTIDGDLQNPPEEIPKLLDAIDKGAYVVTARRAQRYEHLVYAQLHGDFVSHLSALDLLLCEGENGARRVLRAAARTPVAS
ncbi:MAG: WbqC family protein, partial [Proteobacteria bacterium]|nr:WbqC family protein [Pseudomonadota bacterium]